MLKDKDIREPLFYFLEERFGKIRIIEEKTIAKSRADAYMITENALYGIEIKSDADTYARLKTQIRDYNKFYDYNYVCIGKSHLAHINEHIPDFWGIISVEEKSGKIFFEIIKEPLINKKMKWDKKLSLLWRPELAYIQQVNHMPKYKEKSKKFVIDKIVERIGDRIEIEEIKVQISEVLFNRDYTLIADEIENYRRENR